MDVSDDKIELKSITQSRSIQAQRYDLIAQRRHFRKEPAHQQDGKRVRGSGAGGKEDGRGDGEVLDLMGSCRGVYK